MLFSIGITSASWEWDNVKSYDEENKTITITNALGLGSDISTIKLETPQKFYVMRGEDRKVAEFTINNYDEYDNVFNDMDFYDKKDSMKKFDRDFTYKYKSSLGMVNYPHYVPVCEEKEFPNETKYQDCYYNETIQQYEKFEWIELDTLKKLPKGEITMGVFTDVYSREHVEWIPTLFGVEVEEFAEWVESLNVDIESCWLFDTDGDYSDVYGNNNGADSGGSANVSGKIGYARDFEYDESDSMSIGSNTIDLTTENISINAWLNLESDVAGQSETFIGGATSGAWTAYFRSADKALTLGKFAVNEKYATAFFDIGNWHMYTIVHNNSVTAFYIDGSINSSVADNNDFTGGITYYIGKGWDGIIDIPSVHSRAITSSEVSNMYNSDVGLNCIGDFPPTVILNSPDNNENFLVPTIEFNCSVADDNGITNVSLLINSTVEQTNSSGVNNADYIFTETVSAVGFYNYTCQAYDDGDSLTLNTSARNFTYSNELAITLNAPPPMFNSSSADIIFNVTGVDDTSVTNMSFILNATYNGTNSSVFNNTLTQFPRTLADGYYNWTAEACDNVGACTNATESNFTIDTTMPLTNITYPFPSGTTINIHNSSLNQTINWTVTDTHLDSCWINYDFINRTVTCSANTSNFTLTGQLNATFWANDTFGNENYSIVFWDYLTLQHQFTFNASSFETETETFYLNISTNGTAPSSAELNYNGTAYEATITNTAGNDYNLSRTIDIPLTAETKPWFFTFTVGGIEVNSTERTQIINLTNFSFCTVGTPFINISFKNETISEQLVTAQINSDWAYWFGSGTVFKTLEFANVSENLDYQFCLVDLNETLIANVSMTYDNSISQQRSFEQEYSLTNTTTEQILFLLPTSDGVFVTFQTVNNAEQVISDVTSNVTKSGDLIASGVTDDAGLVQYFLDPDTTYVFSFFKSGFEVVSTALKPTQSEYTIIMGGAAPSVQNDTTRGISYTINPLANVLSNNTVTEFNLTFSSSFWSLDIFGFALKNSTGDVFNITTSTTNTGGFLSRTLDTGDNTDIVIEVFWTINNNQTNITRLWKVIDTTDEGFSIRTFFNDLSTYLTSGLFGLDSFGLGIIIFLIIVITTGVMSVKLGITNPAGLSIIVFALVLFFDVGLGIMPNPVGAVPNFPTIFTGVVFLGLLLKEAIIR
jgi:hypothetical protein